MHMYMYVCVYMYMCMYMYMCVYMYMYMYMRVYMYMYASQLCRTEGVSYLSYYVYIFAELHAYVWCCVDLQ